MMKTIAFIGTFKTFQPGILDELDTVAAILEEELNRKVLYITVLGDVEQASTRAEVEKQELDLVIVLGAGSHSHEELASLIRRILKIEFGVTFESIFVESDKFLVETLLEPQLRSTSMEFYRLFKFAQLAFEDLRKLSQLLRTSDPSESTMRTQFSITYQALEDIFPYLARLLGREATTDDDAVNQKHLLAVAKLLVEKAKQVNFSFLSLFFLYYFNLYPSDLQTAVEIALEEGNVAFKQVRDELQRLQNDDLMKMESSGTHITKKGRETLTLLSAYITAYQNSWLQSTKKSGMISSELDRLRHDNNSQLKITLVGRDGSTSIFDVDKLLHTIHHAGTSPTENLIIAHQVLSFFKDSEILLSTYLISFIKFLLSHGTTSEKGMHLIKALRYDYYTRPHHYLLVQVGPRKRRLTPDLIQDLLETNWLKRLSFEIPEPMLVEFSQQLFEDIRDYFFSSLQVRHYILETPVEIPFLELQFMVHVKLLQLAPVLKQFPNPIQAPNPQLTYHENWKICRPYIFGHAQRILSLGSAILDSFEARNIIEFYQHLFEVVDYFVQDVLLTFGYLTSNDAHQNLKVLLDVLSSDDQPKVKEAILERVLHRSATISHEDEANAVLNDLRSLIPKLQEYLTIITSHSFNVEWNDEIINARTTLWQEDTREQVMHDLRDLLKEITDFYEILLNISRKAMK